MSEEPKPRIALFQCQYNLYSHVDREWITEQLPWNVKLVQVPCAGRISPLFLLNAIQGGVDGVLICGCLPEKCHFKTGNLGARRQLDAFRDLLSYIGLESERIRFAWIDPSERKRVQREVADLEQTLLAIGPATRLATRVALEV